MFKGSKHLAHDKVGFYTLSTITADNGGGLVHWPETCLFGPGGCLVLKLYDSDEDALLGHAEYLAQVRAGKGGALLCPRVSDPTTF